MRLFSYLTPSVPLSFKGEGEGFWKRGEAPLRHPLGQRGYASLRLSLYPASGEFTRGISPSKPSLPLPLIKGKGIQGIGLLII